MFVEPGVIQMMKRAEQGVKKCDSFHQILIQLFLTGPLPPVFAPYPLSLSLSLSVSGRQCYYY